MTRLPTRRALLLSVAGTSLLAATRVAHPNDAPTQARAHAQLATLEAASGGRLGVAAIRTADGARVLHRGDERFPVCSTFKLVLAAAILDRSARTSGLLEQRVLYRRDDLVTYSPVTGKHLQTGMTVAELCAAAVQYSDNAAANLLMRLLGGPSAVTDFARGIGDTEFRLDRWETELNTAIPGDPRDTSTPVAMAQTVAQLTLGHALGEAQRARLVEWIVGCKTGDERIRAGLPAPWRVGDKTGTGSHGTTNDIAVAWPSAGEPIVLAVYFTQPAVDAPPRSDVVAQAARIVAQAFG